MGSTRATSRAKLNSVGRADARNFTGTRAVFVIAAVGK
jgi:hypothetical protein